LTQAVFSENAMENGNTFSAHAADLTGVNFSRAKLSYANLSYLIMTEADLTETDLTGADLTRTDVRFSCFNHAKLETTKLNVNLGRVVGNDSTGVCIDFTKRQY